MSVLFLSPEELEELTGYKTSSKQSAWLTERGYLHEIGADRRPKVLRAHILAKLGGKVEEPRPEPQLRLP